VHRLRIALPYVAVMLGVITICAGIFAITQGASAKSDVESKLQEQNITLPDDAAEIVEGAEPGAVVDTPLRAVRHRRRDLHDLRRGRVPRRGEGTLRR